MTPEETARRTTDRLLDPAGWCVQDHRGFDPTQSLGVVVRETPSRRTERITRSSSTIQLSV